MAVTTVFIDIETIPGPTMPELHEVKVPGNVKYVQKWLDENGESAREEQWRGESLLSHRGRVLCIGWAVDDGEASSVCAEPEGPTMDSFWDSLRAQLPRESARSIRWVGFNVTSFDLQWLRHRSFKYGLRELAYQLPADRYPRNVFDLRTWWNGADYQGKGKLEEIAAFFGIEGKTAGMDGSQVFDYWRAGRLDEIADYCRRDVELTRELHRLITR